MWLASLSLSVSDKHWGKAHSTELSYYTAVGDAFSSPALGVKTDGYQSLEITLLKVFRVLIALVPLLLAGCDSPPVPPIKIGVVVPLSGDYGIYGKAAKQAAQLAVEQINAAGGVLEGQQLELVVRDNRTDPELAVNQARDLINTDGVLALLGPVSSKVREAMLPVSEAQQVPLLYGMDYEGGQFSPWLICYSPVPAHSIAPVVPFMEQAFGKRFYIFGYDYVWPHKMAEAIEQAVIAAGGEVVGKEFTPFGRPDFSDVIHRIQEADTDNLMLLLPGSDGFAFIRQAYIMGASRKFKTLAFAADENYLFALRSTELEGIYTVAHFFSDTAAPRARAFSGAYARRYPDDVATYTAKAHYDLIYLLARAINATGSKDKAAIVKAMENIRLDNEGTAIQMRADHHFNLPMYLAQFERGGLWVKRSLGLIEPPDQRLRH